MARLCGFLFAGSWFLQAESNVRKLKIPVQTATADRLIDARRLVRSSARRYPKAVSGMSRFAGFYFFGQGFSGHRHPREHGNTGIRHSRVLAFSIVLYDAIRGTRVAF